MRSGQILGTIEDSCSRCDVHAMQMDEFGIVSVVSTEKGGYALVVRDFLNTGSESTGKYK